MPAEDLPHSLLAKEGGQKINMPTIPKSDAPIGLLPEFDLLKRYPERKRELIEYAIRDRERRITMTSETRHLLSWHPIHTVKIIFVSGFATFILVWLITQIAQIGQWYSQLKALGFTLPLPIIGERVIDLGSHIPTSTMLVTASKLPLLTAKTSIYSALAVMVILILERVISTLLQWKKIKSLKKAEEELHTEIKILNSWA